MKHYPDVSRQTLRPLELERVQLGMLRSVKHSETIQVKEYRCFLANFYEYVKAKEAEGVVKFKTDQSIRRWAKLWRQHLVANPALLTQPELVSIEMMLRTRRVDEVAKAIQLAYESAVR